MAWELRAGDLVESTVGATTLTERIDRVRRFEITGNLDGFEFDKDHIVIAEIEGNPIQMYAQDRVTVWREKR